MEKLGKERYLKRVIVVCWIALAICFGIKLFGGNLFEIMCNNDNFIKVCKFAENHFLAKYLICFVYTFVSLYFFTLAVIGKLKFSKVEMIIVLSTVILGTFLKLLNSYIGLVFDIWQGFIMPAIFTIKTPKKHWMIVLGNVLLFLFQSISMITKNIEYGIITADDLVTSIIFSIDVLLMTILYFAYMNLKERSKQ